MKPIVISFKYCGDIDKLLSNKNNIEINKDGESIPILSLDKSGEDKFFIYLNDGRRIPIDLSNYRKNLGEVSMILEMDLGDSKKIESMKKVIK